MQGPRAPRGPWPRCCRGCGARPGRPREGQGGGGARRLWRDAWAAFKTRSVCVLLRNWTALTGPGVSGGPYSLGLLFVCLFGAWLSVFHQPHARREKLFARTQRARARAAGAPLPGSNAEGSARPLGGAGSGAARLGAAKAQISSKQRRETHRYRRRRANPQAGAEAHTGDRRLSRARTNAHVRLARPRNRGKCSGARRWRRQSQRRRRRRRASPQEKYRQCHGRPPSTERRPQRNVWRLLRRIVLFARGAAPPRCEPSSPLAAPPQRCAVRGRVSCGAPGPRPPRPRARRGARYRPQSPPPRPRARRRRRRRRRPRSRPPRPR